MKYKPGIRQNGGINMNKYVVWYTLSTEVIAESEDEALEVAAETSLDEFNFVDAEVEKYWN